MSLLQESQDRYHQMITKSKATEKMMENKVAELEKEISMLKLVPKENSPVRMSGDFQELLKNQI